MTSDSLKIESVLGPIDEDVDLLQRLLYELGGEGEQISEIALRQIEAQLDEIPARIGGLKQLQGQQAEIARDLERIKNLLSDVEREFRLWLKSPDRNAIEGLLKLCQELLKELRILRIPMLINETRLKHLRIGTPFDFMQEYQRDLYEELGQDVRPDVLRRLRLDMRTLGWVDEQAGMIYRASTSLRRRLFSLALVLGIPIVGLVGYIVLAPLFQPSGAVWNSWAIGVNYAVFIAGYAAHIVKKALEGSKDPMLNDIITWVHVRESSLVWLGLSAWVVFAVLGGFGLFPDLGLFREVSTTTVFTAFAAGMSIDSLAAGVLKHYQRRVSAQAAALQTVIARAT
jgi:hypothetical protein